LDIGGGILLNQQSNPAGLGMAEGGAILVWVQMRSTDLSIRPDWIARLHPTLAAQTKTRRGWGTTGHCSERGTGFPSVVSRGLPGGLRQMETIFVSSVNPSELPYFHQLQRGRFVRRAAPLFVQKEIYVH
jgi:hypothetical protein